MSKRRVYLGRLDVYVFENLWNLFVLSTRFKRQQG